MKKVFIVTLTYKGDRETSDFLDSLLLVDTGGISLNVILVDNSPEKPFKKDVRKYKKLNLKIIQNSENLGFAGGNNKGAEYALGKGADYVLFINNDTVVDKYFLKELLDLLKDREDAGIVVPKIYFEKGYEFHKDRYKEEELGKVIWYAGGEFDWRNVLAKHKGVDEVDIGQYSQISVTDFASGCAFLIKSDVLKKIGLFDEKFFLYYEDSDLSLRTKKSGYKIYFCPLSIVWHKNASSSGGSGSDLQDYYISRNRLLFAVKYAPIRSKIAILRESLRLMFSGRKWQKAGILDFYLGKFGRGSYPIS